MPVGLLAVDVTPLGLVMSSDSQDIALIERAYEVLPMAGQRVKDKILRVRGSQFAALIGYVGTETIGGTATRDWLRAHAARHRESTMETFCNALAEELSIAWEDEELQTCLWVFIAGYDDEARFWYVVNLPRDCIDPESLTYVGVSRRFRAERDLDDNYIPQHRQSGATKQDVLRSVLFFFRNGVLLPSAEVFDAFRRIAERLFTTGVPGFPQLMSIETYAFIARQRMEFAKRLYLRDHGIYASSAPPPIGGEVSVYSVEADGTFRAYTKNHAQTKVVLPS